ncbi:uncharacterized protein LOC117333862 [Pecten maximus]|uniref:uncharacterized protein LOC117333862 n=1 Tax=Pecten maximus TaxID=6579 RepID=UPI001457FA87|nr:uncharacterized protein LOC117333862 [Pecten maximus]
MTDIQLEVASTSRTPSTSTRCNAQSPSQKGRRGSPKCDYVPSTLPNFSPITSRVSSSPHTERDSTRCQLSSLNSSFSERDVCRICHGSNSSELLLSPCYCSGSVGKIHLSCLQRWLGSSNKTRCEICDFQFTLKRKTKPFKKFLANPGSPRDKRNMICDLVCFSLLMPLTITTAWLCISNAVQLNLHVWESAGLVSLALCLIIIFFVWTTICFRQNFNMWKDWSQFNQDVKLKCQPPPASLDSQTYQPSGVRGHTHLTSVEIPIYRRQLPSSHRSPPPVRNTHYKDTGTTSPLTQGNHCNWSTEMKGERSRNECTSPRSGWSARAFQESVVQNPTVKQELFPEKRVNTDVDQRSISPARCNLNTSNDPKCLDNEQKRRKCFSPRPQYIQAEHREQIPRVKSNTLSDQRSRSPSSGNQSNDFKSFHQENMHNKGPRSPNFVRKQESSDQISSVRSNASSGGSSVVHTLPSVTGSSSRSIELIQQGRMPRSLSNHPREISTTREKVTSEMNDPNHYNQYRGARTEGHEAYV